MALTMERSPSTAVQIAEPDELQVSVTGVLMTAVATLGATVVGGGAATVTCVGAWTVWLPVPQVIEYT